MAKYSFTVYGLSSVKYGQLENNRAYYNVGIKTMSYDYRTILVQWGSLLTDPADPAPTHWKLVKNYSGASDTPYDGKTLESGIITQFSLDYLDTDVVAGSEITYSFWVFNGVKWIECGSATAVAVGEEEFNTLSKIQKWVPAVWLDEVSGIGDSVGTPNDGDLSTVLSAYAFAYDKLRAEAALLEKSVSYRFSPIRLLKNKVTDRGFRYEPTLGDTYHRGLYRASEQVHSVKGTMESILTYSTALTHWTIKPELGKNKMLDYNDSSFEESIGRWHASAGTIVHRHFDTSLADLGVQVVPPTVTYKNTNSMFVPRTKGFASYNGHAGAAATLSLPSPTADKVLYGIPVNPNTRYLLRGKTRVLASANAGKVKARLNWYDRVGALISTSNYGPERTLTTSEVWVYSPSDSGTNGIVSPATAAYAGVELLTTPNNSSTVYIFDMFEFAVADGDENFEDARKVLVYVEGDKTNYVRNPSFETNTDTWIALNGTLTTSATPASAKAFGSKVGKLVTSSDNKAGIVSEWIPINPAGSFTLSGYVSGSTTKNVIARLEFSSLQSAEEQTKILNDEDGAFYPIDPYYVESVPVALTSSAQRITVTGVAPIASSDAGYPNAKISFYIPNAETGDILYLDSVQLEDGTSATTYFDGTGAPSPANPLTSEYIDALECFWEDETTSSGRSYRWRNYFTKLARLTETLPLVMPLGTSWEIRMGTPTKPYLEITPNVLESPSFEKGTSGWNTVSSTLARVVNRGSLFDEYTTHGVAFGKVTSTAASTFGIVSDNEYLDSSTGYYTSVALKPENQDAFGEYELSVRYYDEANILILDRKETIRIIHSDRWAYIGVYARRYEINGAAYAKVTIECTPDAPGSGIVFYIDRVIFRP